MSAALGSRSHHTEFPGFDLCGIEIPAGFRDVSWRKDACPSWRDSARGLTIFIDFTDPNLRENEGVARFSLHDHVINRSVCDTDDWSEMLRVIEARSR